MTESKRSDQDTLKVVYASYDNIETQTLLNKIEIPEKIRFDLLGAYSGRDLRRKYENLLENEIPEMIIYDKRAEAAALANGDFEGSSYDLLEESSGTLFVYSSDKETTESDKLKRKGHILLAGHPDKEFLSDVYNMLKAQDPHEFLNYYDVLSERDEVDMVNKGMGEWMSKHIEKFDKESF